jgi:hypothetical protein
MSEATYLIELYYENTGLTYKGLVGERVIDKIKKRLFVEFNLLMGYNELAGKEETANYRRLYYHPSEKMKVKYTKINGD